MPPLIKKILVGLAALLLVFVLLLYEALRTKITNVSSKSPYAQFINRPLVLSRPANISKSQEPDVQAHPYLLTDAPTEARDGGGGGGGNGEGASPQYALPAGTIVTLTEAKLFKNGVSGFEHSYVLGTVFVPELKAEVAFEYAWGKNNVSLTGNEKDYYSFPLALWQDRPIVGKFSY